MTLSFHALWMLCALGAVVLVTVPALEGFQRAMEKATGEGIAAGAERLDTFARQNDARVTARLESVPAPSRAVQQIEGYVMDERHQAAPRNEARRDGATSEWQVAMASLPILGLLLAWRWKRRGNRAA